LGGGVAGETASGPHGSGTAGALDLAGGTACSCVVIRPLFCKRTPGSLRPGGLTAYMMERSLRDRNGKVKGKGVF